MSLEEQPSPELNPTSTLNITLRMETYDLMDLYAMYRWGLTYPSLADQLPEQAFTLLAATLSSEIAEKSAADVASALLPLEMDDEGLEDVCARFLVSSEGVALLKASTINVGFAVEDLDSNTDGILVASIRRLPASIAASEEL